MENQQIIDSVQTDKKAVYAVIGEIQIYNSVVEPRLLSAGPPILLNQWDLLVGLYRIVNSLSKNQTIYPRLVCCLCLLCQHYYIQQWNLKSLLSLIVDIIIADLVVILTVSMQKYIHQCLKRRVIYSINVDGHYVQGMYIYVFVAPSELCKIVNTIYPPKYHN